MKNLILITLAAFFVGNSWGQDLTENLKDFGYGGKKLKNAPKEIYIHQFLVNYQMTSSGSETSTGGKTKAQMAVGLTGIDANDVQEITDQAYSYLEKRLTDNGYKILLAEDVKSAEMFEDWELFKGGQPNKSQLMGYLTTAPTDGEFLIKGETKKGKIKTGILDINPKISKAVGNILIWNSEINFQYCRIEGNSFINDASKLKGTVKFIVPASAIAQSSEGFLGNGSIQTKQTSAKVVWKGRGKGAAAEAYINVIPKKDYEIEGVVEKKKFKEYVSPSPSVYTNAYFGILYSNNKEVQVSHQVQADNAAYKEKALENLKKYIDTVLAAMLEGQ